ncbi:MAG: metal-dependent hydrolase [Candidatus Micrarchaeia archaeon]|jgi:membrane-bound metal-dependent hydrolase YbcI (DUF457 family)
MNYPAHLAVTAIGLALIMEFFLGGVDIALVVIAALSALMPDMDHPEAKGRMIVNAAVAILAVWIAFAGSMLVAFLIILGWFVGSNFFVEHRGHFHSFAAAGLFGLLIYWALGEQAGLWAAIGYSAHILEDGMFKVW